MWVEGTPLEARNFWVPPVAMVYAQHWEGSQAPLVEQFLKANESVKCSVALGRNWLNPGHLLVAPNDCRIQFGGEGEVFSVREGWGNAGGSNDYILLPFSYRGRACYRVLWGVYPSASAARRGAASVPAFFRSQLRGKDIPVVRLSAVR